MSLPDIAIMTVPQMMAHIHPTRNKVRKSCRSPTQKFKQKVPTLPPSLCPGLAQQKTAKPATIVPENKMNCL